jgi:hypothetical protein
MVVITSARSVGDSLVDRCSGGNSAYVLQIQQLIMIAFF